MSSALLATFTWGNPRSQPEFQSPMPSKRKRKPNAKVDFLRVRCEKVLKVRLKKIAKQSGRSMSNLVTQILLTFCDYEEQRGPLDYKGEDLFRREIQTLPKAALPDANPDRKLRDSSTIGNLQVSSPRNY